MPGMRFGNAHRKLGQEWGGIANFKRYAFVIFSVSENGSPTDFQTLRAKMIPNPLADPSSAPKSAVILNVTPFIRYVPTSGKESKAAAARTAASNADESRDTLRYGYSSSTLSSVAPPPRPLSRRKRSSTSRLRIIRDDWDHV